MAKKLKWIPYAAAGLSAAAALLHICSKKGKDTVFTLTFSLLDKDENCQKISTGEASLVIVEEIKKIGCPYGAYTFSTPQNEKQGTSLVFVLLTKDETAVLDLISRVEDALNLPAATYKKEIKYYKHT